MPLYARKTAKNTAAGKLAEWHKASKINVYKEFKAMIKILFICHGSSKVKTA